MKIFPDKNLKDNKNKCKESDKIVYKLLYVRSKYIAG